MPNNDNTIKLNSASKKAIGAMRVEMQSFQKQMIQMNKMYMLATTLRKKEAWTVAGDESWINLNEQLQDVQNNLMKLNLEEGSLSSADYKNFSESLQRLTKTVRDISDKRIVIGKGNQTPKAATSFKGDIDALSRKLVSMEKHQQTISKAQNPSSRTSILPTLGAVRGKANQVKAKAAGVKDTIKSKISRGPGGSGK